LIISFVKQTEQEQFHRVKLLFDLAPSYGQIGNNPVAFYKLDELDGTTTATDYSGNSNTLGMFASANNLNSWDTFGKIGGSYNFTTNAASTRNMLTKATSTMTTGLTQPYSLSTWVAFQSSAGYGNYTVTQDSTLISLGNGVAVADAYPEILEHVLHITNKPGGFGAVREICDYVYFERVLNNAS
jgi:hypothetical protein